MRRFAYLLEKEFKHIFRDKFMPKLIFIVPIIQLVILPFAADFEIKNINICIIDRDSSTLSARLAQKMGASKYFTSSLFDGAFKNALEKIETETFDLILEIPKDFEKNFLNGKAETLMTINAVNGIKGGLGASYANSVISDFAREIYSDIKPFKTSSRLEVRSENRFNENLNSKAFIVPGLMVFLFSLIGGILSSLNIVSEKEAGTMEQMNVAPISKATFIASKILPVWLIGLAILTIGIFIAYFLYGLFPLGSFFVIYSYAAIYLTAFTAFGLIVSNVSSTAQQAILTFLFFIMIFLLMSGLFTPISSMPNWAQYLTYLNPVRYFVETMRGVYLRGAGFAEVQIQFYAILIFAVVLNAYAIISFKRSSD